MLIALLLALPWVVVAFAVPVVVRRGPWLHDYEPRDIERMPHVSIVVPARNEATNIGTCLASLLNSRYVQAGRADIVLVDDQSTDGTRELAEALADRSGGVLRVVHGETLPDGWIGKPWACWQGYRETAGELVLFTDADTRHEPRLLEHAVAAQLREQADLVTVVPHQIMGSFWERIVMPQILAMIFSRYLDLRRINRAANPRDVIANGQFILVRRAAYDEVGGHEAVRAEIVEDLRIAQTFVARGKKLFLAYAEDLLATRMYRSLRQMVEGWSKNLAMGTRASVTGIMRPLVPWLIALFLLGFWVAPACVLALGIFGFVDGLVYAWAAIVTALSLAFWTGVNWQMQVSPRYALAYPLGAFIAALLFIGSALLGRRVTWRGRRYG